MDSPPAPDSPARRADPGVRRTRVGRPELSALFFGANATLTILVLTLITVFLVKEGSSFIWRYHESLQTFRKSGLEFADLITRRHADFAALARYLDRIRADWLRTLQEKGLSAAEIERTLGDHPTADLFARYRGIGEPLLSLALEKTRTAARARDRAAANASLRDSIQQIESRLQRLRQPGARFEQADRADLARRAQTFAEQSELSAEDVRATLEGAKTALAGEPIDAGLRAFYIKLLEADAVRIGGALEPVVLAEVSRRLKADTDRVIETSRALDRSLLAVAGETAALPVEDATLRQNLASFAELNREFAASGRAFERRLADWDPAARVPYLQSLGSFLTGREWTTASEIQNWFGLLPLLSGSLLVAAIALLLAVPVAVGAAVYVTQIAGRREAAWIKPYIGLLSALPSVVLGFFGVFVLGDAVRALSGLPPFEWLGFFPLFERLNAFTAGCLLAVMALPTIFSLTTRSIERIPRTLAEASSALGATRLQTALHIIVPAALPGIISAVMVGFSRVVGETMIVLLCAGNRIAVPDFSKGLGIFFAPTHTMTGIIAQEMGEVVRDSLHYRSLFMVAVVLFVVSLVASGTAQWLTSRNRGLRP